jgi:4-amino-4-deoxy-L-arabinose transferase-like glycosyltransferase
MLTSWHNFFYAAYEPGGSVSVDKPPLGFWVQALSVKILGLTGFALALPQAAAGMASIPLLFFLVQKQFRTSPALLAAAVLAVMPVSVSTDRNNTIDGLLVFVLLLAVWAIWHSVETGRFRFLAIGAVLIGLGFNIKMLQAFMPLLGLYALYLFGAKEPWGKRVLHLGLATLVLLAVSFSWSIAVDLTPASNRPYVGSSTNNSELELIFGWNGIKRISSLLGTRLGRSGQPTGGPSQLGPGPSSPKPPVQSNSLPPTGISGGAFGPVQAVPFIGGAPMSPVGPGPQESGPGLLRLFEMPLADQASWLLPFALVGTLLLISLILTKKASREQVLGLLLWTGWLLPMLAYFSFTSGLFHSYYLIMLGPGIAGLVAAAAWGLRRVIQWHHWPGWSLFVGLGLLTLWFQVFVLQAFPHYEARLLLEMVFLCLAGLILLAFNIRPWLSQAAGALFFASLLVAPLTWSILTVLDSNNAGLPNAGPSDPSFPGPMSSLQSSVDEPLLEYLLKNTQPNAYLVAMSSAMEASPYLLETDREVLTFGGFTGSDNVVTVDQLAQLVKDKKLRFVFADGQLGQNKPAILAWIRQNCKVVERNGASIDSGNQSSSAGASGRGDLQSPSVLYDCAP